MTRFFARGGDSKTGKKQAGDPKSTYGGSEGRTAHFVTLLKNFTRTATAPPALFGVAGKNPPLPPRRRGDRQFTPGSRGTRQGFRPAKIRFVTG